MSKPPTLKDIAKICNVTPATVSRALRNPGRHSGELTARIHEVAKTLGYSPHLHADARRLVQRYRGGTFINYLVALFLPENYQCTPYFLDLLAGIIDTLGAEGYGVIILTQTQNSMIHPSISRGEIDGVISVVQDSPVPLYGGKVPALEDKPIVAISENACENYPYVTANYKSGSEQLAQGLIDSGRQTLIYLHKTPEDGPIGGKHLQQLEGLKNGLLKAGKKPDKDLILCPVSQEMWNIAFTLSTQNLLETAQSFQQNADELFVDYVSRFPNPAIVCPNDNTASLAYSLLSNKGFKVPADVAVSGFEGENALAALLGGLTLTTVMVPMRECGKKAGRLLLDRMATESQTQKNVELDVQVHWGETT